MSFTNIVLLAAIALAAYLVYWGSTHYIGFGCVFAWQKDGSIKVIWRHKNSPAARAGVHMRMKLLSWNGEPMQFATPSDFDEWGALHPIRRINDSATLVFESPDKKAFEVTLAAGWVEKPRSIFRLAPRPDQVSPWLRSGLRTDPQTGEIFTNYVLSDEALTL